MSMNAKKRYAWLALSVVFLWLCWCTSSKFRRRAKAAGPAARLNYLTGDERWEVAEDDEVAREIRPTDCSLDTCFDFARCDGRPFKVSLFCAISKCDQIMGIPMRFCFDVLNLDECCSHV